MPVSVSIIIANYNNSKYINDCLKSVSMLSFDNWEAIVIDDGSTDNSCEIITSFTKRDSRFSLIKLETNQGLSMARNTGLEAARGQYIMFLDSDDCINPGAINILYRLARKYSADAVKAQRHKVSDTFRIEDYHADHIISPNVQIICNPAQTITAWYKDPMFAWLYLYKRSSIKKCRFIPGMRPCEDVNFTIKTIPCIKKLLITDVVSVFYRLSANSIMQNYVVTDSTIKSKVTNCVDINKFFQNNSTCSDTYKQISKKLIYDLLLIDIFYIPLTERTDLLDMTSKIVKSLTIQYDIKTFYSLKTRLSITAFCHKKYLLARLLLDRKYFQKYTRTKQRRKK